MSYQIAQREISEFEGVPNLWKTEKYCGNKLDVRISCGYGFGGYADWIHPDFDAKISIRQDHANDFEVCNDDSEFCQECENYCSETWEVINRHGERIHVCDHCLNEYYCLCEHCEEYFDKRQMTIVHDGSYVCSRCLADEYFPADDVSFAIEAHGNDVFVCHDCRLPLSQLQSRGGARMNNLEDFLRPTQKQLFKRLAKTFKPNALLNKGNFILVHGQAPVMLIAHLDTVHEEPVRDICLSSDKNILMSPQGIGGDDRCGVFALVKVYRLSKIKPWPLFTCNEEVGGLGAKKFCLAHSQRQLPTEIDKLKFIIELDRKGSHDAVFYRSFSDISLIAPELGIAAVNLSCGYFSTLHENPHNLPDKLIDIYEALLDFYSFHELESFRAEFGNHILWQIYNGVTCSVVKSYCA